MSWTVTRHADVVAVLSDPRYVVPRAVGSGPPGTMAWLRETVCRFSEGTAHGRRRAIVEDELARVCPALHEQAGQWTHAALDRADGQAVNVRSLAREGPVGVLGRALGVTDVPALIEMVPPAAADYLVPDRATEAADTAVAVLAELLSPGRGEVVANRIALVVQAYAATAGLIGSALSFALRTADATRWIPGSIIDETLRFDPPVRTMRRVTATEVQLHGHALAAGTHVVLDIAAANRDPAVFAEPDLFDPARDEPAHLTFGSGRRPCAGAAHAVQLAAGVIGAIIGRCRLVSDGVHLEVIGR